MTQALIPAQTAEDWRRLLAEPVKQWARGFSARTLAYCWQEAHGFPESVRRVLAQEPKFRDLDPLLILPEHQTPLPGGPRPSQSDIWVLARSVDGLVSITVEGKVAESFGPTLADWLKDSSDGKEKRLAFLCAELGIKAQPPPGLRYQLLHRTVSALIEARRFTARHAIMMVHSFSREHAWFSDFKDFASLFGILAEVDRVLSVGVKTGCHLHLAWVHGEEQFLNA